MKIVGCIGGKCQAPVSYFTDVTVTILQVAAAGIAAPAPSLAVKAGPKLDQLPEDEWQSLVASGSVSTLLFGRVSSKSTSALNLTLSLCLSMHFAHRPTLQDSFQRTTQSSNGKALYLAAPQGL